VAAKGAKSPRKGGFIGGLGVGDSARGSLAPTTTLNADTPSPKLAACLVGPCLARRSRQCLLGCGL
jgi:hypothetical protein